MLAGEQISSYMIKLCIIILINEIHWWWEIYTESSTWAVCNCIKKSNAASTGDFPSQSPSDPISLFGLCAQRSSIFPSKDLQTLISLMVRMLLVFRRYGSVCLSSVGLQVPLQQPHGSMKEKEAMHMWHVECVRVWGEKRVVVVNSHLYTSFYEHWL